MPSDLNIPTKHLRVRVILYSDLLRGYRYWRDHSYSHVEARDKAYGIPRELIVRIEQDPEFRQEVIWYKPSP